jgi:hypothetical protein
MKIKVTPLFPFPLYCMGGRTKIEDSEKKKWTFEINFYV